MSSHPHSPAEDHASTADTHAAHGTYASYLTGFALSALLTAIAFGVAMMPLLSRTATILVVTAVGLVQICVQNFYFMHLTHRSERWNFISFFFTVLIIAILVGGSLWIMFHLNRNMMM
jgi:cytochrome o ubiquinol oxidase subunit IV